MATKEMTYADAADSKSFPWWIVLLEGIFSAGLGLLLLISPITTTIVIIQFMGIYWMVHGIFAIVAIFLDRSMWGLKLAIGILGILAGLSVIQNPLWSAVFIPTLLIIMIGVQGVIGGGLALIGSFKGGGLGMAVVGAISIAFGLILLGSPLIAAASLPFVLGVMALVGGIAEIFTAFRLKNR